jgi:hypothetical protein
MANIHQIMIGNSPDRPALVLRECSEYSSLDAGEVISINDALCRVLAALQGLPRLIRIALQRNFR